MQFLTIFSNYQAGFPCSNIDEMERIELSDEEAEDEDDEESNHKLETKLQPKEQILDPRAGKVDVEIPQVPFDPTQISNLLKEQKFHKLSTTQSRKEISRLISE